MNPPQNSELMRWPLSYISAAVEKKRFPRIFTGIFALFGSKHLKNRSFRRFSVPIRATCAKAPGKNAFRDWRVLAVLAIRQADFCACHNAGGA
jgi:hypothetical protein